MVANPAAARSDPAVRYPAVKPLIAAMVPHTSASPNRARHVCHHPALAGAIQRSVARRTDTAPPGTSPVGNADMRPVPLTASAAAVTPRSLMLVPRHPLLPATRVAPSVKGGASAAFDTRLKARLRGHDAERLPDDRPPRPLVTGRRESPALPRPNGGDHLARCRI